MPVVTYFDQIFILNSPIVHVVHTIRNFELSHLVIELLVCYLCIIDTLSSLVIMILGNEHNWEF